MSARPVSLTICTLMLLASAALADPIGPMHTKAGAALVGKPATVRGVVTAVYTTAKVTRLYLQDATGGVCVYGSPVTCAALGDSLEVTGTVATYSGLTELSGRSDTPLVVTRQGRAAVPPRPALLSISQLGASEKPDGSEPDESRLVTLQGVFIRMIDGSAPAADARFKDDTNYRMAPAGAAGPDTSAAYGILRVQDAEGCEGLASLDGAAIPAGPVSVTGVVSQHADRATGTGGYQVLPRSPADLQAAAARTPATRTATAKPAGH